MNPSLIRAELQRVDFSKRPLAKDILASLAELMEAQPRLTEGVAQLHGLGSIYFALQAFFRAAKGEEEPRLVARRGNVFQGDRPVGLFSSNPQERNRTESGGTLKPNLKLVTIPTPGKPGTAFDELVTKIKRYSDEIERTLGQDLKVDAPGISVRLGEVFGTEMAEHGRETDATGNPVYLSTIERAKYLVRFRGGRAYCLKRRLGLTAHETVLDTPYFDDMPNKAKGVKGRAHRKGAWGFVLSLDRQFYVAPHGYLHLTGAGFGYGDRPLFFHSSYLSGERVLCAGDCIVENGQFISITNASGHYQPPPETLAYVIESLRQYGVDVSGLRVATIDKQNTIDTLSDPQTFAQRSVLAYEFIHFLRGGVTGGFGLDAVPPQYMLTIVKSGLATYGARFHVNPSRESKAAVSWLKKLVEEEEALQKRNAGGSRKLADAIAYLLGKTQSPGSLDFGVSPLKRDSSLYQDLEKALAELKTGKVTLEPARLPFKDPKTAFR